MQKPEPRRNIRMPILETKIQLPTDCLCQIYPRVSTPEQKKNVSAEMQQDKSFAVRCGWSEDLIIVDKRDLGVSGQLRMEDRLAFRDMLRRMEGKEGEEKKIRAIIARDVARLFRNKWGDEPGKFMEICFRFNVLVVTADFVYDFRINWHIDKFKRKCEEAWNHMENHVFGVMLPAMDERGYAGYWVGGNLPMGYVVDRGEKIKGEKNPNYNRFLVSEPHAKVIKWLFRRFKQLCGNARALLREIERMPVLFPDFSDDVPEEIVASFKHYKKVSGGYTIASDGGLRHVLTNRIYIGYWIYQGEVVRTNNDLAIVDYDDFLFAYNRLSLIKLDGAPNENALQNQQKYARKYEHSYREAGILKECIEAASSQLRIYPKYASPKPEKKVWYYAVFRRGSSTKQHTPLYTVPLGEIDGIVLKKLIERMQEPQAENDLGEFLAYEDKAVKEASETLNDIERDLLATRAVIERLEKQASLGLLTDEDLQTKANEGYQAAKADLKRLEARKRDTTQIALEDEERRSYRKLMQDVGDAWDEIVMPEEYPRLIYLFIGSVVLDFLSPRFFTLTINWRDPSWQIDEATCYKYTKPAALWMDDEITVLREHYATATQSEILQLLPRRTYGSICNYAEQIGLARDRAVTKSKRAAGSVWDTYKTCWLDLQQMEKYGVTEEHLRKTKGVKIVRWACLLRTP